MVHSSKDSWSTIWYITMATMANYHKSYERAKCRLLLKCKSKQTIQTIAGNRGRRIAIINIKSRRWYNWNRVLKDLCFWSSQMICIFCQAMHSSSTLQIFTEDFTCEYLWSEAQLKFCALIVEMQNETSSCEGESGNI